MDGAVDARLLARVRQLRALFSRARPTVPVVAPVEVIATP
jgi:hypothetical protein